MMNRREARLLAVKVLLQKGYEWLACDADGTIVAYEVKPFKMTDDEWWNYDSEEPKLLLLDNAHDINFVKWEDEEPASIAEWIKKEEEEMIDRREARYASVDLLLDNGYQWLARDVNGSIAAYSHKPFKLDDDGWLVEEGESKEMWMWVDDGDLYNFVKWEDDEPVNIREWLKEEEREMKLYYVKNGQLESKDVDVDFFEKNTTLGGLLPSDEVALGRDDCGETIKVTAENWGKSAILEKANNIREALEMATDYGYKPSVSIVADQFEYTNKMPRQLSLDNVQIHGKVCQELTEIYKKKNADYGNSFENSLDKHGLIAAIVRMDDKMSRGINLNKADEQLVNDESVRDTLMDLANYAIMSVMWLDNKSGEAFRAGFVDGISGANDRDIYADNQKLDIDKALREGAHPQAIRDFLGGADYDGDTTNS